MTNVAMFLKPVRGTFLLERRAKRRSRVTAEQREMQAAKVRDGGKCRWPRCDYAGQKLPIDPCHFVHRSMGGNPKGDRTTRQTVISLCRVHHGLFDRGDVDIVPMRPVEMADGPCVFFVRSESGRMDHVATERVIGVSETRGA
jgi:hypothetical protein